MRFTFAARIFRIFFVLIVAIAVVWATNLLNPGMQSALPYVFVALLAWEFTRILTMRFRKRSNERRRRLREP